MNAQAELEQAERDAMDALVHVLQRPAEWNVTRGAHRVFTLDNGEVHVKCDHPMGFEIRAEGDYAHVYLNDIPITTVVLANQPEFFHALESIRTWAADKKARDRAGRIKAALAQPHKTGWFKQVLINLGIVKDS